MVCEKALLMNKKLGGPKDFKASHGWLHNFKSRHGIRELDVQGEHLSCDTSLQKTFKKILKRKRTYKIDYNAKQKPL